LILEHHKKQKGIILVPSFVVAATLANKINVKGIKIFEHIRGNNAKDIVDEFKNYSDPSVLISPSIFEGVDFYSTLSEFQIFVKTPYGSLGDARTKKIADEYGSIYREITLYKILQGIGRSVRSKEDIAVSYFLDKSSETLFKSNLNLWKDRYCYK
jgi:Rad3-related DNA helicase